MQVSVGLAMTIGLERLRARTNSIVHDIGAQIIGALTLAAIVFGLVFTLNPQFTGRPVGGAFFNLILLGYGIPAVLAAILALVARDSRPLGYRYVAATSRGRAVHALPQAGGAHALSRRRAHAAG